MVAFLLDNSLGAWRPAAERAGPPPRQERRRAAPQGHYPRRAMQYLRFVRPVAEDGAEQAAAGTAA